MPENLHTEYFDDLWEACKKYMKIYGENRLPYRTSVIVASKPQSDNGANENTFN